MNMNSDDKKISWLLALEASLDGSKCVLSPLGDKLPSFPSEEWQIHTVGLSGRAAIQEAANFMENCTTYFKKSPLWSKQEKQLLDFGTGWGRIARCFLRDFKGKNIVGSDVNPHFLKMCRDSFSCGSFIQSEEMPPLSYTSARSEQIIFPSQSNDFIVAYSVFSHLSEQASVSWINEFKRILRPGGMLAITTRGRWFFDTVEALKNQDVTGYAKGLSEMFEDFSEAKKIYDAGNVVHVTNELIGDGRHYGETFIPEAYVRKVFASEFDFVAFHQDEGAHPIIVLQNHE
jgi:ubiquinone/menaquinone biosynthesis C-methylase UbiE